MSQPFFAPESISADGITIRTYHPDDGAALQVASNSSYEHLRPWMAWARPDQTLQQSELICRRAYANYLLNNDFVLSIWVGNDLAGGSGFHLRGLPFEQGCADIGMWIRASYAGQGLGSRALALLLTWGFSAWPWQRLTWHCDTRNTGSRRVAEKNGMQFEGTHRGDAYDVEGQRRDTLSFAILRGDWQARQNEQAEPAA